MSYSKVDTAVLSLSKAKLLCDFESEKIYQRAQQRGNFEDATRQAYAIYRACLLKEGYKVNIKSVMKTYGDGSTLQLPPKWVDDSLP